MDSRTGRSYEELDANIVFAILKRYFILFSYFDEVFVDVCRLWVKFLFFILLLIYCKTVLVGQQEFSRVRCYFNDIGHVFVMSLKTIWYVNDYWTGSGSTNN